LVAAVVDNGGLHRAGLPVGRFNGVLALDPQDPSILYAGTVDQGIFRLDLGE
jgi:hypothetical protein